jgi:hypothetical protein
MTLGALITSRIGTLTGSRVYCSQSPAGAVAPYMVWNPISDVPNTTQEDYRGISTALVQVNAYALTAAAADALRTLAIDAMCSAYSDTTLTDGGRMQFEDAITPPLFNAQADFEITYAP